ncbi:hypothetical protein RRSWK_04791 [Rhodopirellula sp. SWK7]|nr:hypothetical protein RRSWK_04791 [Rhodopirellula sp. SWK7]
MTPIETASRQKHAGSFRSDRTQGTASRSSVGGEFPAYHRQSAPFSETGLPGTESAFA